MKSGDTWWRDQVESQRFLAEYGVATVEQTRAAFERNEDLRRRWAEQARERWDSLQEKNKEMERVDYAPARPLSTDALILSGNVLFAFDALTSANTKAMSYFQQHLTPMLDAAASDQWQDEFLEACAEAQRRCETVYALLERFNKQADAFLAELSDPQSE